MNAIDPIFCQIGKSYDELKYTERIDIRVSALWGTWGCGDSLTSNKKNPAGLEIDRHITVRRDQEHSYNVPEVPASPDCIASSLKLSP